MWNFGFTPLISKATNFFRSASTSIDHIWCNKICKNTYTGILNESTSSHKPIFANIATKINEISTDSESVTSYFTQNISARNIEKFESEIHKVSDACKEFYSNPNISSKEAQRQFSSFYTKLKDVQSCAISIRQSRILFFFPIENFKASVQFKLIYFIQIKR